MISFEKALETVLDNARTLESECVDLDKARGRVLVEDVVSDVDMPAFDKSLRDGYACRRADLDRDLDVIETIPAGVTPQRSVGPGQCAKIMTGAVLPAGADCVVMVEQTELIGPQTVRINDPHTPDHIASKATDVRQGQVVLRRGSLISSAQVGILASVGCVRPRVAQRPRVAVLTGGDELVEPSVTPGPSQIRNSNHAQLKAQIQALGAVVQDCGTVKDVSIDIDRILKRALSETDVVVVSGGVSMGDLDLVPSILEQNHVNLLFRKIAVKPGKPTVFGVSERGFCFGLPGNPVSTFVTFELLVKPFLYRLMGHAYAPRWVQMTLDETLSRKNTNRQAWIPVKIEDKTCVRSVTYHGSGHLVALAEAQGLIRMDVGVTGLEKGTPVSVRLL